MLSNQICARLYPCHLAQIYLPSRLKFTPHTYFRVSGSGSGSVSGSGSGSGSGFPGFLYAPNQIFLEGFNHG